ncbi:MAG: signal transduction histidine kinase [Chlamydiales bacterium]|jgi:signal transduction histidine kinase
MNSNPTIALRSAELSTEHQTAIHQRTDRLFAGLLAFQFVAGVAIAQGISPGTWLAGQSQLLIATLLGGVITGVPILFALKRPGQASTRHAIAAGQVLTGALLIHLCGGRAETHLLAVASLAFLACYRDRRVLMTATAILVTDYFLRGTLWPQSLFGSADVSQWRSIGHVGWLIFTSTFLLRSLSASERELHATMDACALVEAERDALNKQLGRSHKLEAVGQLTAGIAHEINTPTQYVSDNTHFLQDSFEDLTPLLELARELAEAVHDGKASPEDAEALRAAFAAADLSYLVAEIPRAIGHSIEGIDHVAKIILAMREFSNPDDDRMIPLDLNHAVESTLTVATSEWKYVAELETDFDATLPHVPCLNGEINQVILNMIVNAAHAITSDTREGKQADGMITVSTHNIGDHAEIRIADTGAGIPKEARATLFDPVFRAGESAQGIGSDLPAAHSVIVEKHGGTLTFETTVGHGTTFIIRLPFEQRAGGSKSAAKASAAA